MMVKILEQLLPKFFFRFGHFYFFANLFMGYINNIVMKNFSFHSTKVFIIKKKHTQNLRFFAIFFGEFAKNFYSIRKSIKCGIKCKKFH